MAEAVNRKLGDSEIRNILAMDASTRDRRLEEATRWPSQADKLTLAQAVKKRSHFVTFSDGRRYVITYKSRYKAVFVKPDSNNIFVPCGYFSYEKLQNLLDEQEEINGTA